MADPRVERYASLLVDTCVDVQPGWEVLMISTPLARPLLEELARQIGRKGAYVYQRLDFTGAIGGVNAWLETAPDEILEELPRVDRFMIDNVDCVIGVSAPENTRAGVAIPAARMAKLNAAYRPAMERIVSGNLSWVGCQFPCPALAQEAGMSLDEFEDFLYGACLIDWDAERERMQVVKDRLDAADEVRIVASGTDVTLNLAGREGKIDAGGANMPGGEVFYSPVETSANGEVLFSEFPAVYDGRELTNIRFRFEDGVVVEASADREEDFLLELLDTDEGSRRLGELGFGCNPGITRHMKNTLFDEKINGTVHLALGNGFEFLGGTNESNVHWDIVKDLRDGGRIYADGALILEDGDWRL
ncbi:MAG: aminopeptidase [Actinobacteria bacterium]|nr:aminopeptidase [Actinomycetota bacterium]